LKQPRRSIFASGVHDAILVGLKLKRDRAVLPRQAPWRGKVVLPHLPLWRSNLILFLDQGFLLIRFHDSEERGSTVPCLRLPSLSLPLQMPVSSILVA
jgi:hypothetical protein